MGHQVHFVFCAPQSLTAPSPNSEHNIHYFCKSAYFFQILDVPRATWIQARILKIIFVFPESFLRIMEKSTFFCDAPYNGILPPLDLTAANIL